MKSNKNKIYSALTVVTALLAQLPASAQETADSALVNVAFKKVQKTDVLGGVGSINVRELTEKNYNTRIQIHIVLLERQKIVLL